MKKVFLFIKNNLNISIPASVVVVFFLLAVFAPVVAPYGYAQTDFSSPLEGPSIRHIFGTDQLSRDVLSRMIYSLRMSLFIGFVPTTINIVVGCIIGIYSGLSSKYTDSFLMRITDIGLSYPFMILAMAIIYNIGPGLTTMVLALTIFGWTTTARVIRSQTKSISKKTYMDVARSMDVGKARLIKHVALNAKSTIIVLYTMSIPQAILAEAGISFLGFGAQAPMTSLGVMVASGRSFLFDAPWISIAPGLFILILSVSFNFLGDGLRDYYGIKREDL